jgi:hypothetical protein
MVPGGPGKKHKTLPKKQLKAKRAENVGEMIEYLHSKHEALISNPRPPPPKFTYLMSMKRIKHLFSKSLSCLPLLSLSIVVE